ncbi:GIY-YIG nuclease family protein [Xanthobacter flavus]|uniref:GIY-YIG nuclease family protein n=1 Tax=Xanthobacter flavus TaxID=281 RepID=UPI003727150B
MADFDTSSSVWLTSFWGFSPEEEGVLGFTKKPDLLRFMSLIKERQLVCIYGAASPETDSRLVHHLLGILDVERTPIDSFSKMSEAAIASSIKLGRDQKWRFAVPARRAWRTNHRLDVRYAFPRSYDPDNGRNISKFGKFLVPEEAKWLLEEVPFTETNVFGERAVSGSGDLKPKFMSEIFRPSRGIFGKFGERSFEIEDKPYSLYLAELTTGSELVAGREIPFKSGLFKIGISNNTALRLRTINISFPESSRIKWKLRRVANFKNREPAANAENAFKDLAISEYEAVSLGREFFIMNAIKADMLFNRLSPASGLSIGVGRHKG